jgi:hypothetical protein
MPKYWLITKGTVHWGYILVPLCSYSHRTLPGSRPVLGAPVLPGVSEHSQPVVPVRS